VPVTLGTPGELEGTGDGDTVGAGPLPDEQPAETASTMSANSTSRARRAAR